MSIREAQIEREKQLIENQRAEKKLQDLMADRKSMAVESPADGYVYYGRCTRGKWPGVDAMASQLQEGGKLTPNNVFMTVVVAASAARAGRCGGKGPVSTREGPAGHGHSGRLSGHETPDAPSNTCRRSPSVPASSTGTCA